MYNDSDSSDNEGESSHYLLKTKYTIVIVDCTSYMKEDLHRCLSDLYTIYATLQSSAHIREFKTGIITIGCRFLKDGTENSILLQPKTFDINQFKSVIDNFDPANCSFSKKLALKEGIEMAVDLLNQCTKSQDSKTILFITSNPMPEFENTDDTLSAARMLVMNDTDFLLLPFKYFTSSKFYSSFFKQLKENTCELLKPEPTFLNVLCNYLAPAPNFQKTSFYYNEDNCFEMNVEKMFQIKYRSLAKAVDTEDGSTYRAKLAQTVGDTNVKLIKLDDGGKIAAPSSITNDRNKLIYDKLCKIGVEEQSVVFTKEELIKIDQMCSEPKQKSVYLLYVGDEANNHVISDDVKTRLLRSGSSNIAETMFISHWDYCVKNNKVLYCIYLTKKRSFVVLKPIKFRDTPYFIQYCIGYANNYNNTKLPDIDETATSNEELENIMENIVLNLKTGKSFLDFRDSKLLFEEELQKAKLNKVEFEYPTDELSIQSQQVDKRIDSLAQKFEEAL